MKRDHVFCGVCGHRSATALFEHIKTEHSLDIPAYEKRCPGAPLFTESFGRFVARLQAENGRLAVRRELFGVPVTCDLAPREHVPAVDEAYEFDERLARGVTLSLAENDRVMLVGPTGSGKSSLLLQLAARMGLAVSRANLHGETTATDFLGQYVVEKGQMVFQYGILPRAMKAGHLLVLEELDAAEPAILFALQGVLEENGRLMLAENNEVVEPSPAFRLASTCNTLGLGDDTGGLYTGTRVLNQSFLDRWTACYTVNYLPPEREEALLRRKVPGLKPETASALVRLANAVREAKANEQVFTEFSTRRLLALGRKLTSMKDPAQALEITVLNRLAPNDRRVVQELAQRIMPETENGGSS